MSIEMLVGVYVVDDDLYQRYRELMLPILQSYGGGFGYDFRVSEVLLSQVDAPINRVFTIFFESEESKSAFFADEAYLDVRTRYFEPSVTSTTIIANYQK